MSNNPVHGPVTTRPNPQTGPRQTVLGDTHGLVWFGLVSTLPVFLIRPNSHRRSQTHKHRLRPCLRPGWVPGAARPRVAGSGSAVASGACSAAASTGQQLERRGLGRRVPAAPAAPRPRPADSWSAVASGVGFRERRVASSCAAPLWKSLSGRTVVCIFLFCLYSAFSKSHNQNLAI
jgi:hypothetical protein